MKSSRGCIWTVAMSTAIIIGETKRRGTARTASVPCAALWAPTCLCGLDVKQGFMWTQDLQLMRSARVDTCARKRQLHIGPKFLFLTVLTLFMQPVPSVHISWLVSKATSDSFSKDLLTNTRAAKDGSTLISWAVLILNRLVFIFSGLCWFVLRWRILGVLLRQLNPFLLRKVWRWKKRGLGKGENCDFLVFGFFFLL